MVAGAVDVQFRPCWALTEVKENSEVAKSYKVRVRGCHAC
jgi:hypothetical protein